MLFSLLTVCQLVIDVGGELSARRGERFEDYTHAIRNLAADERFPVELVRELERLPGFRNVLIHEYVALDMARVMEALPRLDPIERSWRSSRGSRPGDRAVDSPAGRVTASRNHDR